ncbi:MAG: type IV pilus modification PilV family protein [Lentisphaeria bacterium]|jgi:hypothetical protein
MRTKHFFNMVEIMLALGVCAIGVCSIMVLFPVGANATRDAAMETYAAHAADQMLHFMKYRITANNGAHWGAIISDASGEVGGSPPADSDYVLAHLNNSSNWTTDSAWTNELKGTVYQNSSNKQIYQIMSHRNAADDKLGDTGFDTAKIDFRGILTIWKEQISVNGSAVPLNMGVKLNVKVAWPAELPATSRQVAYYSLEVFKP